MAELFLEGRVALVTGGFTGIGLAIAEELLRRGASIAIGSRIGARPAHAEDKAYFLEADEASAVRAHLETSGGKVFAGHLDVGKQEVIGTFVAEAEAALGPIDILVNNAGTSVQSPIIGHSEESWLTVIDTNLNGAFRMTRTCMPGMLERRWGRIINIASTAASTGHAENAAYCASKAGLLGLTRVTALEGAPHGVTCAAISPTWVETRLMQRSMTILAEEEGQGRSADEMMDETRQVNPQNRIVQVEEVAALAAFLCREEAKGITMEDIQVSAGAFW
ncbi:MAG: SDR family NAD(P)-dependent oxidoreductase [Pseudomonadota bacterium]